MVFFTVTLYIPIEQNIFFSLEEYISNFITKYERKECLMWGNFTQTTVLLRTGDNTPTHSQIHIQIQFILR